MLEKGMKVEVIRGNLIGVVGEIVDIAHLFSYTECTIKPDNMISHLVVQGDYVKQIPKYNVGDSVQIIGNKSLFSVHVGSTGSIVNIDYNHRRHLFEYHIVFNGAIQYVYNEDESDLQKTLNIVPTNGFMNKTVNITYSGITGIGGIYGYTGDGSIPDTNNKPKCPHSFKFYFGLMERYEYCEHCDEKRATDRWS